MNLTEQIVALKIDDDSCGLKQNAVIDKVLEVIEQHTCKSIVKNKDFFNCDKCDSLFLDSKSEPLIYCPHCGKKIER